MYLCGRIWDRTRDRIGALGITRGKRLEVIWTDVSLIENLRCQKVFHPAVLEIMHNFEYRTDWWGKSKSEKADAEAFVKWWKKMIPPKSESP